MSRFIPKPQKENRIVLQYRLIELFINCSYSWQNVSVNHFFKHSSWSALLVRDYGRSDPLKVMAPRFITEDEALLVQNIRSQISQGRPYVNQINFASLVKGILPQTSTPDFFLGMLH